MLKIDNKVLKINGGWLNVANSPVPPTPTLPPYTLRLLYKDGVTPTFSKGTGVQVSSSPNIWDLTYENSDWTQLLGDQFDLLEIIEANIAGVVNMQSIFRNCTSLTTVPLFDTSNVTNMIGMFDSCYSLTNIPLFNTSSVTSMQVMFYNCYNVQSGTLALYQQASTQATIPGHSHTFRDCGRDTTTGAAELAQIPDDWK